MEKLQKSKWNFRTIKISLANNRVPIYSDQHNQLFNTPVRNATEQEKRYICQALDFIEERVQLKSPELLDELRAAQEKAVFLTLPTTCATGARAAYWWHDSDIPVVYLNRVLYQKMTFEEFAVTVLHELLHTIEEPSAAWPNDGSDQEARHDFECYRLLDLSIPASHWALTEHPDLIKVFPGLKVAEE